MSVTDGFVVSFYDSHSTPLHSLMSHWQVLVIMALFCFLHHVLHGICPILSCHFIRLLRCFSFGLLPSLSSHIYKDYQILKLPFSYGIFTDFDCLLLLVSICFQGFVIFMRTSFVFLTASAIYVE